MNWASIPRSCWWGNTATCWRSPEKSPSSSPSAPGFHSHRRLPAKRHPSKHFHHCRASGEHTGCLWMLSSRFQWFSYHCWRERATCRPRMSRRGFARTLHWRILASSWQTWRKRWIHHSLAKTREWLEWITMDTTTESDDEKKRPHKKRMSRMADAITEF